MDHEPLPVMTPKLQDELWFHGSITRQHAEALLKHVSRIYNMVKNTTTFNVLHHSQHNFLYNNLTIFI